MRVIIAISGFNFIRTLSTNIIDRANQIINSITSHMKSNHYVDFVNLTITLELVIRKIF
jgi:uncharacterized membrane-anchored protein